MAKVRVVINGRGRIKRLEGGDVDIGYNYDNGGVSTVKSGTYYAAVGYDFETGRVTSIKNAGDVEIVIEGD